LTEAEARFEQALAQFNRLGAVYDVMSLYHDLAQLFLARRDFTKAEEMATLLERNSRLSGSPDLTIKALMVIAECEQHTDRYHEAANDYCRAAILACDHGECIHSCTASNLLQKFDCWLNDDHTQRSQSNLKESELHLEALRQKLHGKDFQAAPMVKMALLSGQGKSQN
jgi:hypothetical protein